MESTQGGNDSEGKGAGNYSSRGGPVASINLSAKVWYDGDGKPGISKDKDYYTREELNDHYKGNTGDPVTINLAKIDLTHWTPDDFDNQKNKEKWIQTLWWSKDGTSLGHIKLRYIGNGKVIAPQDDIYNFDQKSWLNPGNWIRNIATWIGDPMFGKGFIIHFTGEGTLGIPWRQTEQGQNFYNIFNYSNWLPPGAR